MKLLFLILIASITFTRSTFASLPKVLIINCYDGDTCTTLKGETIRLACIDTPELKGRNANPIKSILINVIGVKIVDQNKNRLL